MVMNYPEGVNRNISLDGEYKDEDGFVKTLKFGSGKERTWLANSYVPKTYPSLSLLLDNNYSEFDTEETELDKFVNWFQKDLRYGSLPFYFPRIGFKRRWTTAVDEMGVYKFIPDTLNYDRVKGMVLVNFGLKEEKVISEVKMRFWGNNLGQVVINEDKKLIRVGI